VSIQGPQIDPHVGDGRIFLAVQVLKVAAADVDSSPMKGAILRDEVHLPRRKNSVGSESDFFEPDGPARLDIHHNEAHLVHVTLNQKMGSGIDCPVLGYHVAKGIRPKSVGRRMKEVCDGVPHSTFPPRRSGERT
jgi:hypothetical protein